MSSIKLFLCGDVMTGRGIDQILASPCDPTLHEGYVESAADYVTLAENLNGPIPHRAESTYIWGDALNELERFRPDCRIINLETAVTRSDDWLPKGINYRMSPANIECLTAAAIDCCALANNHVLDWGEAGLVETLETLQRAGIRSAGAGLNAVTAETPAKMLIENKGRILVFSIGTPSSGVPPQWAATARAPGVDFLPDLSHRSVERLARRIETFKQPGDVIILSIHWGGNWGYETTTEEIRFAHAVIDSAGIDVVHGHSSHHPKGMDVYRNKLLLYGCGDFINDYEGIRANEEFRGDLRLMYLATIEVESGQLLRLELVPLQSKRLRICRATDRDAAWLCSVLSREGRSFGTSVRFTSDNRLELEWGE